MGTGAEESVPYLWGRGVNDIPTEKAYRCIYKIQDCLVYKFVSLPSTMLIHRFVAMFFLLWLVNVVNGVALSRGEEFWISSEIQSVQWKDDCLTAATCSSPRFQVGTVCLCLCLSLSNPDIQLTMNLASVNEKMQSNWPAHDEVTGKVLSTHWTLGFPEDVQISSQVVGTDPEYGFQRNCDTTFTKRVFSMKKVASHPIPVILSILQTDDLTDNSEVAVKLQARCYNVTLILKKYTGKCPWCPEEQPTRVEMVSNSTLKV